MKHAALLIEDNATALVVRAALECAGMACEMYATPAHLMRAVRRDDYAAFVIDITLPGVDCSAVLAWRRNWLGTAIAVIAVGPDDAVCEAHHIDLGVDDFIAKPVRGPELLARLRAALRRIHPPAPSRGKSVAGCWIDRTASAIVSNSSRVALTSRELGLAHLLFECAGELVTRIRLARDVWGQSPDITTRSIEQHVYQLRRKLRLCAGDALSLRGIYGIGYRLDAVATVDLSDAPSRSLLSTPMKVRRNGALSGSPAAVDPLSLVRGASDRNPLNSAARI